MAHRYSIDTEIAPFYYHSARSELMDNSSYGYNLYRSRAREHSKLVPEAIVTVWYYPPGKEPLKKVQFQNGHELP